MKFIYEKRKSSIQKMQGRTVREILKSFSTHMHFPTGMALEVNEKYLADILVDGSEE